LRYLDAGGMVRSGVNATCMWRKW